MQPNKNRAHMVGNSVALLHVGCTVKINKITEYVVTHTGGFLKGEETLIVGQSQQSELLKETIGTIFSKMQSLIL